MLKCLHYHLDQAVSSGDEWHISSARQAMCRALDQYIAAMDGLLAAPQPKDEAEVSFEDLRVKTRKLGSIKSGKFLKAD